MRNGIQDRRNVAREAEQRKRRFTAALALAGLRQSDFADLLGIDQGHLSKVVNGERISKKLTDKMDAFTAKHLSPVERKQSA